MFERSNREALSVGKCGPVCIREQTSANRLVMSQKGHNRPRATAANPQQRLDWQLLLSLRQRLCDLTGTLDEKLCDGADRTALQGDDPNLQVGHRRFNGQDLDLQVF